MEDAPSGQSLNSMEVELGISASGEVGLIVAKSEIELRTAIKLTFVRAKP
jgi:hypothetical protein